MPAIDLDKAEGPKRAPGAQVVRPRAAATLILVRQDSRWPQVLLGRRNASHSFMPNLWVFPGGRVDRADSRAPFAEDLQPHTAALFDVHLPPGRGRALAMAAVRETFEEAGLLLARPAPPRRAAGPWREFLAQGALPDLSAVEIVSRAITPPMIAKRFDTWFLMADASRLISLERQPDCGELEDVAWVDVAATSELKLPQITRMMLTEAMARLETPDRPRLFLRHLRGTMRPTTL